jgi:benzoate membrane transport protein
VSLLLERPAQGAPGLRRLVRDSGPLYAANGLVGLIFAATGPVAVILAVGRQGGLSPTELASWVFGVFFLNGILTVAACWLYRQPLAFFWTIPGTVLVGPALRHLSLREVVGAYLVTGALMLLLGLTGWVGRAMAAIPMPIVMGMVAGVFLHFGTDLIRALGGDVGIAAPMVAVFILLSAFPLVGGRLPPVVGALLVGAGAVALSGRFHPAAGTGWLAAPVLQTPQWSLPAMVELVLPLAVTVLVVQNGQGIAVLRSEGHEPPINVITILCGAWSILAAFVGAVSTCLTGPTNALLAASGERARHYTAGVFCGLLAIVFGLFAPVFTRLMLAAPPAFIATLGGLAMLRVLQASFVTAFAGRFTLGALVSFVVTVADVSVLKIGAAFWGLVAGLAVSWLLERSDFPTREPAAASRLGAADS